jgi:hypothetical protein
MAFSVCGTFEDSPHTHQTMEPVSGYSRGKPDAPDTAFIVESEKGPGPHSVFHSIGPAPLPAPARSTSYSHAMPPMDQETAKKVA